MKILIRKGRVSVSVRKHQGSEMVSKNLWYVDMYRVWI